MKNKILYYISLGLLSGTMVSCNDLLDEKAKGFISDPSEFYQTVFQCQAAANSCYNQLNNVYNQSLLLTTDANVDIAYLNNSVAEYKFDISPSAPGFAKNFWVNCYNGVMVCNAAIENMRNSRFLTDSVFLPGTETRKDTVRQYLSEAITLRAIYYYNLTSVFGDVPFYMDNVKDLATQRKVARIPRMSATLIRDSLITDLDSAAVYLPKSKSSAVADNRVSAHVAWTLAAKMCLWNQEYERALYYLNKVKAVYGVLSQYPIEDVYFRNSNTPESIFEIQYTWAVLGLKKTHGVACYFTPTRASGASRYDGVNIPELGDKATLYSAVTPTWYYIGMFESFDARRNISISYGYNGTNFSRVQRSDGTGKPWPGPKFWRLGMDNNADGNNLKVFRYADVLLMIAECENELQIGDFGKAELNEVRARAGATQLVTVPGQAEMFELIYQERAKELFGEFHRKFDLVRRGLFYDRVRAHMFVPTNTQGWNTPFPSPAEGVNQYPEAEGNLRPWMEYYPIPDNEIVRSKGVLTNDAYNNGAANWGNN